MKNEKVKIDIGGSISDTSKDLVGNISVGIVILMIVGSLIAPIFAYIIEAHFQSEIMNNGRKHNYSTFDLTTKMRPIKIGLWVICIISWSILFWCNTPH